MCTAVFHAGVTTLVAGQHSRRIEMSNDTKKVLIGLPSRLLANVDLMAKRECRTRSGLIREALRRYYDNYRRTESNSADVQRLENIFTEIQ